MKKDELLRIMKEKRSFLCIGLDSAIENLPSHILKMSNPQYEFNKIIFDATVDYTPVYKINTAFYEALGLGGWESLVKTVNYIRASSKKVFLIADAKRGDIGNTSKQYAKAFFEKEISGLDFDAVTVSPYMGMDSVVPFLEYDGKWVIILTLTSNTGSEDFQMIRTQDNLHVFEHVLKTAKSWGTSENTMYVVGATRAEWLKTVRKLVPAHFILVPGIGVQGGSLDEVADNGFNKELGLIVNVSRSVIFASSGFDFAEKSEAEAKRIQTEMKNLLNKYNIH